MFKVLLDRRLNYSEVFLKKQMPPSLSKTLKYAPEMIFLSNSWVTVLCLIIQRIIIVILPRGQTIINVEFTSRFLHPAEAVLLLISKRMGEIGGATLTFSLKSEVKHIEPAVSLCVKLLLLQKILFRCWLYQSKVIWGKNQKVTNHQH